MKCHKNQIAIERYHLSLFETAVKTLRLFQSKIQLKLQQRFKSFYHGDRNLSQKCPKISTKNQKFSLGNCTLLQKYFYKGYHSGPLINQIQQRVNQTSTILKAVFKYTLRVYEGGWTTEFPWGFFRGRNCPDFKKLDSFENQF